MAYADYNFYVNTYFGDILTVDDADLYLERASSCIDRATRSGVNDGLTAFQMERVKFAVCLTADFLSAFGDASATGTVSSYSIGDVSLSLSDGDRETMDAYGVPKKAYEELIQTGLLYRGL